MKKIGKTSTTTYDLSKKRVIVKQETKQKWNETKQAETKRNETRHNRNETR